MSGPPVPAGQDPQPFVAQDPVGQVHPRALQPAGRGRHPDADHHQVGGNHTAAGQPDALDPAGPDQAVDADAEADIDPVAAMGGRDGRAHLGADGPLQRDGRASTTVTSRPRWRALAATSRPMNPAPMTTTRSASARSSRRATASSMVRR